MAPIIRGRAINRGKTVFILNLTFGSPVVKPREIPVLTAECVTLCAIQHVQMKAIVFFSPAAFLIFWCFAKRKLIFFFFFFQFSSRTIN